MFRLIISFFAFLVLINNLIFNLNYTQSDPSLIKNSNQNLIVFFGTTPAINGIQNFYFSARLKQIIDIYNQNPESKILITGYHSPNYSEIEAMQNQLTSNSVPQSKIILHYAEDTFDSLRQIHKMYQSNNDLNPILVSQKFHLQRANFIASVFNLPIQNIEAQSLNDNSNTKLIVREYFARLKVHLDLLNYFFSN